MLEQYSIYVMQHNSSYMWHCISKSGATYWIYKREMLKDSIKWLFGIYMGQVQ